MPISIMFQNYWDAIFYFYFNKSDNKTYDRSYVVSFVEAVSVAKWNVSLKRSTI